METGPAFSLEAGLFTRPNLQSPAIGDLSTAADADDTILNCDVAVGSVFQSVARRNANVATNLAVLVHDRTFDVRAGTDINAMREPSSFFS